MANDYRLPLMTGVDIPLPELKLVIHVPTIRDIAYMGEQQFFQAVQYICLHKEQLIQDKTLLQTLSNFQVLMKVLEQSQDKTKRTAIITLLKLLFPDYQAIITMNSIILNKPESDPVLIDDTNFEVFQEAMRQILCVNSLFQGSNIIYNPKNDRAREIANKLMKGRQKVAEIKNADGGESALTRYISILTVAKILSLDDCTNLNLFQLFDLMERYSDYVEWDIDLRVKLAGGKPEKQVEPWMKDLHPKI